MTQQNIDLAKTLHAEAKRKTLPDMIYIVNLTGAKLEFTYFNIALVKRPNPHDPLPVYRAVYEWPLCSAEEVAERKYCSVIWMLLDNYFRAKDAGLAP